ncbi:uncharacterized protein LOC127291309 [Leptopilina boulardi]|uniref:uncharacterized protein LOC127291309 n=1 Tax=Leptopilina boulardi TaxID=63433 RepID=UPI0021F53738|nr:uncharacterized protein LOC127291309 [Leptopilina boulardi]XP_051176330.1 uncharacterized protein LOC127291309 [Leptopilina boulardi]XP_051176331.1 uncharacterized protein LOC127291309 [Leptopilina boulardi]XP_051176332.1 uncharacterized protein LOC127291309 [Leptopilina boulardi]
MRDSMRTISGSANGATKNLSDETRVGVVEKDKCTEMQKTIVEENDEEEEEICLDEKIAPDGGWGWMVAVGLILVFTTTIGPAASFTIVFGDFLNQSNQASSATTILNSIFNISFSLAGVGTNPLLRIFSVRTLGIIGAVIFAIPNILAAFVSHVFELGIIFFLQGIGLGLIFTICNTNFNAYFVKRRATVMSACQTIVGLGCIVYPIWIEKMMKAYGFRGTAAIIGALSLNCIVGMALMHPVDWHYKRSKKNVIGEKMILLKTESIGNNRFSGEFRFIHDHWKRRSTIDTIHPPMKSGMWNSLRSLTENDGENKTSFSRRGSVSNVESGIIRRRANTVSHKNGSVAKLLTEALSSSSLANLRMPVGFDNLNNAEVIVKTKFYEKPKIIELMTMEKTKDVEKLKEKEMLKEKEVFKSRDNLASHLEPTKKKGWSFSDVIDMDLMRDQKFINTCLGISFVFTSDFTFSSLLPLMMAKFKYTQTDAALAITVGATAELISKILLSIFTLVVDARPKKLFFVAMICMALAKIGFFYLEHTMMGLFCMVALIGMVRSWLMVPQALVVVENISVDKFAAAYGVFAIISGLISIVFGPAVGLIKDWTNSYDLCQLVLVGLNVLFIVPWGMEFLSEYTVMKNDKKRPLSELRTI